ncbi:zinc finger protein 292 isoform X1 [Delphinus delphis]|uniref:zinc finger protein 292 isoform X1 n=2 Tax=Delphinus delphis TaxID=9728 RepID=UPI0028C4314A|nr:zinc finger protein 292 isoform X1 [Delphinus delphis]
MADEEAEQERLSRGGGGCAAELQRLGERLQELERQLRESRVPAVEAATEYCQQLCQTLLEYAEKWKTSEDPLPLLEVYTVAIQSYVKARPYLTSECENVALVLERLALSCVDLLLCLPVELSDKQWEQFQTLVQVAHEKLMENGSCELHFLATLAQETGVWKNPVLCTILSQEPLDKDKVNEFLAFEGPILLDMRIKHLIKTDQLSQATALAKLCSDHPEIGTKGSFKQTYLVCLCTSSPNEKLIEEISEVDCKDALEMICNLESEGDEKNALVLCTAFLSRQLQQGDMYCAWELTLFWSKLQQRVEPSIQVYLERCRQLSLLTKTVYHIFFLIKVINSETEGAGLATCIELCVKALRLESTENTEVKISICKTISCLLPDDLEVKRACQLSEFLIEPTVDAYYAVEMLYNQPDQKYDEENLPIPNSLRCELLLVLKTQWPFDPEFWDWKTLKRQCLALMGEEASIVSSIDELNDSEVYEKVADYQEESKETSMNGGIGANSGLLRDICDEKQKKREIKQLRERGFISARFRNWQAYMQYCVLCDKEFLGHRIVRHAQKHYKDGIYSCPICAKNFNSKETFVPHVTLHVKQSSKERLAAMKPLRRLGRPPKITTTNENQKTNAVAKQEQRPIKKNSLYSTDFIVFNDNDGSDDETDDKDKSYEPEVIPVQKPVPVNEFNCPVTFCKKGFKYFKNLIAHVKGHKDNEDAKRFLEMQSKKVICQYCRRHFVSVTHLNDHLQMHCGSKPYICIQMKCKAGFNSYAELLTHRKEHQVFRAKCMFPKCGRIFSEAYLLYDHEAQHYNTYTCKFTGCGKVYRSQSELEKHLDDHSTPEKVLPPEDQLNSSGDSVQPSRVNQNAEGNTKKEGSVLPSENNMENTFPADRSGAWDKSKAESPVTKQDQISASELKQADGPLPNGLENPAPVPLLQASEVAVSIKVSLNQGIEDNFGKQENSAVQGTGESLVTNLHTPVEDPCNDLCHTGFQERKEQACFNEAQITQNSLVDSEALKIDDLTPQNLERQVNNLMTFSVQNQAGFQNNLPTAKFECGGNVKTSSNLYNLPLKTLESITFVPPQPNLSNSLGTPSVPPKAPVQKFSCQVEGCTRTYNSSQSIGKHMKTAHPDQYAAFKMQRKSKRGQKANNLNTPNNGKFVYFLPSQVSSSNNAFFTPQTKANGNPTCSNQLQHVSPSIFPAHLANVSAPLLPSVESVINPNIPSQDKNEQGGGMLCSQMENLSSTTLPAQMEDLTKTVLPLNIDSGSDPFLPLPAESSSMSLFPSPADSGTNSVFSQLENNTNHFSSQIEGNTNSSFLKGGNGENAIFPSQVNVGNDFSGTSAQQSALEKVKKDRGQGPNGKERKPKHNKRAKWPAIIRDGKFICSRCYRAFTNPRSLGGHLSKRSYCKPLDGAEIAQELLQSNGQPSLLASMILSTNAVNSQQPQQPTFSPGACFKDPSFLQLLAAENRSSAFLPNTFPRSGVTNFNTSVSQEGSEIIKQALETAGIPSTFEGADVLSHVPPGCVSDPAPVNATVMPNPPVPPLLQTVCHANPLLTDQTRTPNSKTSSIEECNSLPVFPANDLLLKTVENGLCSSSFPNSSGPSQNFISNSSRVSVISGPQNTRSSHLNKKGNSASKRRKKVAPPLIAPNAPQNLVTSDLTAMGLIAKRIEIPTTNLHSTVIPNCEPQGLVENLTQKLNNVDNQLFITDVKENFKTSLESHTVLAPLTLKTENGDSQMMALNSCTPSINSDLQISEDNVIQNFEKTLEIIKSAMNSQILEVKSGSQGIGETSQNAQINYNIQLPSVNTVQNNKLSDSSQFSSFIGVMPTKSNIPQPEILHKEDQVQEILEGLQKLKLENDLSSPAPQCVLINTSVTLTPTPVKPIPNVTLVQPVSEMISNIQFNDRVNKPFVCQNQGCNYSAMTKDALFKHYGKIHQYTPEMILEIKKNQLKFAPFKCVVPTCTKTFTRNSNLRAHCQLVHHFTTEEMVKLKIKRPYGRKSQSENSSAPRITQVKRQLAMTEENKREFQPALELGTMKENTLSNIAVIPEKQLLEKKSPDKTESSSQVMTVTSEQCNTNSLTNVQTKGRKVRRHKKEKEERKRKKPVSQSLEFPTRYSPYRPYRCVHQGCFAAFTIQQNLILHYQAVHKSDLPAFSAEVEEESEAGKDSEEIETKQTVKEFRCQVSDCSRIFQAITGLIQHYMKLHEMSPEEIESMTASVDVGKFPCDQSECKSSFTTYLNYVVHLEADHGIGARGSKTEEDGIYKCDCEGCDRIYATRSNLLRHIFNKHNDKHKAHLIRPRRLTPGQENISSKANQDKTKSKHRGTKYRSGREGTKMPKTKRKKKNNLENKTAKIVQIEENKPYSLKRGKHVYSIKARNDALSECTSRFVTQYPCMIKGCTSVVTSESNIIRHYKCHKLSKAFTSQHRNLLIVFKRCCNSQLKETSEQEVEKSDVKDSDTGISESSDNSRTTVVPQKEVEKNEKDEVDELTELFITKLINEDNTSVETQAQTSSNVSKDFQEDNPCQSEKQKASNLKRVNKEKNVSQNKKRKVEKAEPAPAVEFSSMHKEEETAVAIQTTEEHPASFDWSSFKPMGFEVSFLKFLEESAVKQKKNTDKDHPNSGNKKGSHSNARKNVDKTAVTSGNHICSCKESETFVQFANPSQLQCSDNVKIVLDKTLKNCTELVLKQLQEMKPTVSLKKLEVHSNDPDVSVMKEISMGKATGRGQN